SLSVLGNKGCIVRIRDDSRREADRQQLRRLADQLTVAKAMLERQNALFERQNSRRADELQRFNDSATSANKTKAELSQDLCDSLHRITDQVDNGKVILEQWGNVELYRCLESIGNEAATLSNLINQ